MSNKKIALIILCSIFGFILLGSIYLYSDSENRMIIHVALRSRQLTKIVRETRENRICFNSESKPNCFSNLVLSKNGIEGSTDIPLFMIIAFDICNGKNNKYCNSELVNALLNQIDLEKLWLSKNIAHSDKKYNDLFNLELSYFNRLLRNYRKMLVDQYNSEIDPVKKTNILYFIKLVDSKIQLMQRSQKLSQ